MATRELRYGPDGKRETGKWRARVKENWQEHLIGTYATKEEAEEAERAFKDAGK